MTNRFKGTFLRAGAAILSGLLLAAAFPPLGAEELAWVALIPLLAVARFSPPREAFRWGFLAGLVFWLLTLAWLRRLARFETSWVAVISAWAALAAYCALYMGVFAAVAARLWRRGGDVDAQGRYPGLCNVGRMLALVVAWVGFEYVRYTFCTGFAWNALGVSQFRNTALIQICEWTGVYGVSALVVLVNAALGLSLVELLVPVLRGERAAARIHVELLVSMAAVLGALAYGNKRLKALDREALAHPPVTLRCASVQANVAQDEKWSEDLAGEVRDRLIGLTQRAGALRPDLIVWPETSVPTLMRADPGMPTFLNALAQESGPLLAGAIEAHGDMDDPDYYNSALFYDRAGDLAGVYRKQHLVPFGEYLPLEDAIPVLQRFAPLGYSCQAGTTGTVFRMASPDVAFSALICFEDAIAGVGRQAVRNGARLLVNQTNDGWFEETCLAAQHLSQCVFRSVENRVPVLRCANLGISCVIDRAGRVDASTMAALRGRKQADTVLRIDGVDVPAAGNRLTFYTRRGDWAFAIPCAGIAVIALLQTWWVSRRAPHA